MKDGSTKAGAGDQQARQDSHVDEQSGLRVPTPDPKDQTGDPEADNAAMRELHRRKSQGNVTES